MDRPIYLLRNKTKLISETGEGYVNLCESLASLYKINNRTYGDIFDILYRFPGYPQVQAASDEVMYSGAERIDRSRKDLVHVTVIKNWKGSEGITIMGNTCGHLHAKASTAFVEIYQLFDGFLGLAIHQRGANVVELHLRRPGELLPIRIPSDSMMTLFSLGAQPVVTLDWATAEHHSSKTLQETIGPVMAMVYNPPDFVITLNPLYVRQDGFGVKQQTDEREVHIKIGADWSSEKLFFMLQRPQIMESLSAIGIRVVPAGEAKADDGIDSSVWNRPLFELAKNPARLDEFMRR